MPVTLLAVDDSVTMRKVYEMTFGGEEFRVVTADNADAALALLKSEKPALVLADITLPGKSGYDLCATIKRDNPGLPVLLMSSKLNPYDKARGQAANANDYVDKPFDTQKLIDRVNSLLSGEKTAQVQGAPKAAPAPYRAPAALGATLVGQGPPRPQAAKPAPVVTPAGAQPVNLRATADFAVRPAAPSGPSARAPLPPSTTAAGTPPPAAVQNKPAAARPAPVAPKPAQPAPAAPTAPAAAKPVVSQVAAKADGELTAKLHGLGLTKDQVEGVLALSHDLVERVVWEVVPVLAETMIKEELKRLTDEA